MRYVYIILAVFILTHLVDYNALKGQQYTYKNYTIDDGLPSNTIYKIDQDSKGYLWISTGSGASRFNGASFFNFNNKNGLSENIFGLQIDVKDRVWFESYDSYSIYYKDDSIYRTNKIPYLNDNSIKSNHVIHFDSSTIKVYQRENAIATLNLDDFSLLKLEKFEENSFSGDGENVHGFQHILKGFGSLKGVKICDSKKKNKKNITRENYIFASQYPNLWMQDLSKKGVYYCRLEGECLIPERQYFPNYIINSVFEDKSGNIWFGSQNNGLFLLPHPKLKSLTKAQGLESNGLYSLAIDHENKIWVGTDNGFVNKINPENLEISGIRLPINSFQIVDLESHKNEMWVQVSKSSLYLFENGKHKAELLEGNAFNKDIFIDNNGNVWGGGSFCFDRVFVDENKHKIIHPLQVKNCLFPNKTFASYVLDDRAFVGTNKGLYKLEFGEKDTTSYYFGEEHKELSFGVRDIELFKNKLWVATVSSGIVVFDLNKNTCFSISSDAYPLGNDACKEIFINEKTEEMWVATNNGVTKISNIADLENLSFKIYNTNDGLISNEATDVLVDKDGTTWVTTKRGLTFFNESEFSEKIDAPQIFINAIQIWDRDTIIQDEYVLNHMDNFLSISFEGLDFNNVIKYKYKLDGHDEDWIISNEHKARYSKLPAGSYDFNVYAINEDGLESDIPAHVKFEIKPPFWMTWWFWILVGLIAMFCIGALFTWRLNMLKRKNEMAKLSLRGLGSQMNAHFLFNSLNSIQNFLLDNQVENAHKYLTKFSRLIRQTLVHLEKENITIQDEMEVLKNYLDLEAMRMNDSINYQFVVGENIDENRMKIQPMLLQPYIENSVRWGLKDIKKNGNILIEFKLVDDKRIKCIIEDNGIGRRKAQEYKSKYLAQHKSIGTKLNEERIKLLASTKKGEFGVKIIDLYDEKDYASGTKVEILLPIEY